MTGEETLSAGAGVLMGELSRRSVREAIAGKLAALISSEVLAVGDPLPGERELAASLGVSRETVRGAIAILAAHGILRVAQGARTTVARSDTGALTAALGPARGWESPALGLGGPYALEQVHEARVAVERHLAAEAARRGGAGTLRTLAAAIAAQEAALRDPVRFLLSDREFHAALYRAGGNDVLFDIAMTLYSYLLNHRRRIVSDPAAVAASIGDHRAILRALESGDPEAAAEAVAVHAARIFTTTRAFLDARQAEGAADARRG